MRLSTKNTIFQESLTPFLLFFDIIIIVYHKGSDKMKRDSVSLNNNCGCILSDLRKDKRLTQKQLAAMLNVSTSALGHYEQGVSMPSPQLLISLADFFHVPVDYLLGKCTCKTEYTYLSDKFYDDMSYGDVVNQLVKLSQKDKQHIYYLLKLIKSANND